MWRNPPTLLLTRLHGSPLTPSHESLNEQLARGRDPLPFPADGRGETSGGLRLTRDGRASLWAAPRVRVLQLLQGPDSKTNSKNTQTPRRGSGISGLNLNSEEEGSCTLVSATVPLLFGFKNNQSNIFTEGLLLIFYPASSHLLSSKSWK